MNTYPNTYPNTWPTANPKRPESIASRITEQQKQDLYARAITTRSLAKELKVNERTLSTLFPGKVPIVDKKPLVAARKEFKLELAKLVISERYTLKQAAAIAHISYSTIRRYVKKAKALGH